MIVVDVVVIVAGPVCACGGGGDLVAAAEETVAGAEGIMVSRELGGMKGQFGYITVRVCDNGGGRRSSGCGVSP